MIRLDHHHQQENAPQPTQVSSVVLFLMLTACFLVRLYCARMHRRRRAAELESRATMRATPPEVHSE